MVCDSSLMTPDLDACIREQMARWTVPGPVVGLLRICCAMANARPAPTASPIRVIATAILSSPPRVAHPLVTVEVGGETFPARATVAEGAEWARLYEQHGAEMPGFLEYRKKTSRHIPVIILERFA